MSAPAGERFRARTLPEKIGAVLPSQGPFAAIRRALAPLLAKWPGSGAGKGLRAVLPAGEIVVVAPAFRHITWNREEYVAFRAAVRAGDVVLEAGANVGAYTMLFAQWAGTSGHVFAFEPDPAAGAGLHEHIGLNAVGDRVTVVAAAVADGSHAMLRFVLGESPGVSRLAPPREAPAGKTLEVRTLSIDQFCAEHRLVPRVIKIDVEGTELAALRGARATIAHAGSGLQLFVEMHPQLWDAVGISADEVRRECEAQGLVPERLDGSTQDLWQSNGVCLRLRPKGV
jgi:FkbM family methyltransferase